MESTEGKRPADEIQEPDAKRSKVDSVENKVAEVCSALSKVELRVPWSESFLKVLLAWSPPVLGASIDGRNDTDKTLLMMLDEIFDGHEEVMQGRIAKAEAKVAQAVTSRSKAKDAEELVAKDLEETVEEIGPKFEALPKDVQLVKEAETKLQQSMHNMMILRKDTLAAAKKDCFEELKAGSWASDSDRDKLLLALMPVLQRNITDATLLSSSSGALIKKPDDRGTFGGAVVQQIEEHLQKCLDALEKDCEASLQEQEEAATSDTKEQPSTMSIEQAEAALEHGKQVEMAKEKLFVEEAKRESFEKLKAGSIDTTQKGLIRKHITTLKKVCRKDPDGKALVAAFPAALQTKPDDRDEDECKVIDDLESAIDKRLAVLQEKVGDVTLAEKVGPKKSEIVYEEAKKAIELEAEQRDSSHKKATKEKDVIVDLKIEVFEPLKCGSWESAEAPKPLLTKVKKLFKQIGTDDPTSKTLLGILKKKPDDRAAFDVVMVDKFEESINKCLSKCEQQLSSGEAERKYGALALKEIVAEIEAAHEALEEAQDQQLARLQDAVDTEKMRQKLVTLLETRKTESKDKCEKEKEAESSVADAKKALVEFLRARGSLTSLRGCTNPKKCPDGDAME